MATRGNLANRTVVGWSQYEGRQQKNPKLLKREAVWESQEQEGVACITRSKQGNSPVSTARRSLFFFFITSIHLCLFQLVLFLSFILPLPSLCLFFYTAHSPPPWLPEALSSELPRFFIKELKLKPSNYYWERENTASEESTWGEKSVFHCFPPISFSIAQIHTDSHRGASSYSEGKET